MSLNYKLFKLIVVVMVKAVAEDALVVAVEVEEDVPMVEVLLVRFVSNQVTHPTIVFIDLITHFSNLHHHQYLPIPIHIVHIALNNHNIFDLQHLVQI